MKQRKRRLHELGGGVTLSPSSADTQIDSLIISFENESVEAEDEVVPEGTSIRAALKKLTEAPEDEEPEAIDEPVTTDDEQTTDEPAEPLTPKINVDIFAEKVAMLIETYTKRLDIETVIFNRAKNYLVKEHGEDAARQFEDVLVTEHDIDLRNKTYDEPKQVPAAVGAGPEA